MRPTIWRLAPGLALLFVAPSLNAQELEEICPDSEAGTGVLWGAVMDAEGEMTLPGATVIVRWREDGEERRAEVQTGIDGSYTVCYLPLETELAVQASFSTMSGEAVMVTMSEEITRQDVGLALGGASGGEDDRIWMCVLGGQSTINIQNSRLFRCDPQWQPLERCPKEELGRVSASPSGAGSGMMREMLETLENEARRLGANALINVQGSRNSIRAEAVRIEVDPMNC